MGDLPTQTVLYMRWIVEIGWYKPWEIHHVAGKLNVVADTLSRKRENYPELKEAFCKRKPCDLGECPDCLFHKKKMDKCRDTDSDDSEENQGGCYLLRQHITDQHSRAARA